MTEKRSMSKEEFDEKLTQVYLPKGSYHRQEKIKSFYVWKTHAQELVDGIREDIPVAFSASHMSDYRVTISPMISEHILEAITNEMCSKGIEGVAENPFNIQEWIRSFKDKSK
jgi:stalled ribosome alternative rescue factor ArfA